MEEVKDLFITEIALLRCTVEKVKGIVVTEMEVHCGVARGLCQISKWWEIH